MDREILGLPRGAAGQVGLRPSEVAIQFCLSTKVLLGLALLPRFLMQSGGCGPVSMPGSDQGRDAGKPTAFVPAASRKS